jgi:hypothetical protein
MVVDMGEQGGLVVGGSWRRRVCVPVVPERVQALGEGQQCHVITVSSCQEARKTKETGNGLLEDYTGTKADERLL